MHLLVDVARAEGGSVRSWPWEGGAVLHDEFMVEVVALQPWGAEARSDGGADMFIDHAKTGTAGVGVGERVLVVVLDDARRPVRASLLADDIEIGRRSHARRGADMTAGAGLRAAAGSGARRPGRTGRSR